MEAFFDANKDLIKARYRALIDHIGFDSFLALGELGPAEFD